MPTPFNMQAAGRFKEALKQLEEIGPPPYDNIDELIVQRNWLQHFGGLNHSEMGDLFMMGATSPAPRLTARITPVRMPPFALGRTIL